MYSSEVVFFLPDNEDEDQDDDDDEDDLPTVKDTVVSELYSDC